MFPNVQFIVTTHSPLFVLGMQQAFGDDGFALYRLPQGHQISPEEFSEFGQAYRAFMATSKFSSDIRAAVDRAQKPIVFVEGTTDQKYLRRAAQLLEKESVLAELEVRDIGGSDNLAKIWKDSLLPLTQTLPREVLLLFDCDEHKRRPAASKGKLFQRTIPRQSNNPIQKGIENLFSKGTLEKARQHKPAFVDIDPGRTKIVRGEEHPVSDTWSINQDEKTNLCDWICENAAREDFKHFQVIFDVIEKLLDLTPQSTVGVESETAP